MPDLRRRRSVSQAYLATLLDRSARRVVGRTIPVATWSTSVAARAGMAMSWAPTGYRVRVVDPSPDALAALERRTAEEGLERGRRRRCRATPTSSSTWSAPTAPTWSSATRCSRWSRIRPRRWPAIAAVLRPGGALEPRGRATARGGADPGPGRSHRAGPADLARSAQRFDRARILALVAARVSRWSATHGVGSGRRPRGRVGAGRGAGQPTCELLALEAEVAEDPAFQALAPHLHVFAVAALTRRQAASGDSRPLLERLIEYVYDNG